MKVWHARTPDALWQAYRKVLVTTPQQRKCDNCGEFSECCQQPKREWVGLTKEQKAIFSIGLDTIPCETVINDIEAVLRANNTQTQPQQEQDEPPSDENIFDAWVSASESDGIGYDGPSFERGYRLGRGEYDEYTGALVSDAIKQTQSTSQEPVGTATVYEHQADYKGDVLGDRWKAAHVKFKVERVADHGIAPQAKPAEFPNPITEDMHVAAVKVLHRANGVDGLPQQMLDAMLAAAPKCGTPTYCNSVQRCTADDESRASKPAAYLAVLLTVEDHDLCRQWFDSVQDTNKSFLTPADYHLAEKFYQYLGMRVPDSIAKAAHSIAKKDDTA